MTDPAQVGMCTQQPEPAAWQRSKRLRDSWRPPRSKRAAIEVGITPNCRCKGDAKPTAKSPFARITCWVEKVELREILTGPHPPKCRAMTRGIGAGRLRTGSGTLSTGRI